MARRTAHGDYVRALREQLGQVPRGDEPGQHSRIFEDNPKRTWRPHDKSNDEAMNVVLDILIRCGEARQSDIADEVAARLHVPLGTARAYTSGALLAFRETGWAVCVHEGRPAVWRIEES